MEKEISNQRRKINIALVLIFFGYFIFCTGYLLAVNNRAVMKTDIIERKQKGNWGGGGGMNDKYFILNKDYHLERRYFVFPSVQCLIERSRVNSGSEVSYFLDKNEISEQQEQGIIQYTAIGLTEGDKCVKGIWYFYSLLSYVLKNTFIGVGAFVLLIFIIVQFKPTTPTGRLFNNMVLICIFLIGFVL